MKGTLDSTPIQRTPSEVLGVRGVVMTFGGTRALDGVDLELRGGQIHALLGENGAGKSTLIKILAGVHTPDSGRILLDGAEAQPHRDRLPIAFIHQDLGLVESLSIAENVALATGYARGRKLIRWREVHRRAAATLRQSGLAADTATLVSELSAAERSIVAIARALALDARVIVLDEPTASLAEADVAQLFDALRRAADAGTAILYVTHRLDEVFRLADQVTVLRNGRLIATGAVAGTSTEQLVRDIIGTEPGEMFAERPAEVGGEESLIFADAVVGPVGPFSLRLRAGEIVGLTGRRGAGHEQVGRCVIGDRPLDSGRLVIHGHDIGDHDPRRATALGVALVPAKRADEALASGLGVRENLFPNLTRLGAGAQGWRRPDADRHRRLEAVAQLSVRTPSLDAPIETLSGGNQQKVVLTRCLETGPRTLVLEEPTTGVDVGTKAEIYRKIAELASAGAGILIISSDFEEVAGVCDRAVVFNRGRVAGELRGPELDLTSLVAMAVTGTEQDHG